MAETEIDDKEYYYVTYQGTGIGGAIILPQYKVAGGGENPDGFNIASATQHLFHILGFPVIVMGWQRATRKQRDDFEKFINMVAKDAPVGKPRPNHLTLVSNESLPPSPEGPPAS